jgi:hypothetical protein
MNRIHLKVRTKAAADKIRAVARLRNVRQDLSTFTQDGALTDSRLP